MFRNGHIFAFHFTLILLGQARTNFLLRPPLDKRWNKQGPLILVRQPTQKKENSEFKPIVPR